MKDRTGFVFKVRGYGLVGEVFHKDKNNGRYQINYYGDYADYEAGVIYETYDVLPETLENNISNGHYIPIDEWFDTLKAY